MGIGVVVLVNVKKLEVVGNTDIVEISLDDTELNGTGLTVGRALLPLRRTEDANEETRSVVQRVAVSVAVPRTVVSTSLPLRTVDMEENVLGSGVYVMISLRLGS